VIKFKDWWNQQDIFCGEGGMEAAEHAFQAATEITARICGQIAEQRFLAENQAVEIAAAISKEFTV
jgi:hypothetical protein